MPLYEYQCDGCGHRFEVIHKWSDSPVETCPKCGGVVQKLPSSPAIQFKGSGFYITDYARAGKSEDSSNSGSSSGQAESSASSSDTKSESKSESKESKGDKKESKGEGKTAAKTETKTESKSDAKPSSTPSTS